MDKLYKILLVSVFTFLGIQASAQSVPEYNELWAKVYRYEWKEFPLSASKMVDSIYLRAKKDKNEVQLIKSLLYQSKFLVYLQEDAELRVVNNLRKEIQQSQGLSKYVLTSVLAQIYRQYYNNNRWEYLERAEASPSSYTSDFRLWDIHRMYHEVDSLFQASLVPAERLQKEPINDWLELLIEAQHATRYRPTLYDFLAHEAIDFYQTAANSLLHPSREFGLADTLYLTNYQYQNPSFPSTMDFVKTLAIYDQLMAFHSSPQKVEARAMLELQRAEYVKEQFTWSENELPYLYALQQLQEKYAGTEAEYLVMFELAYAHFQLSDSRTYPRGNIQAMDLCNRLLSASRDSVTSKKALLLKGQIEKKEISLEGEDYVTSEEYSKILVEYRNIDSLYLAIIQIPFPKTRYESQFSDSVYFLLAKEKRIWESKTPLPSKQDYFTHSTEVLIPPLPKGAYRLLVSTTPFSDDSWASKLWAYQDFTSTQLTLIMSHHNDQQRLQVLDRTTGKPLARAQFKIFSRDNGWAKVAEGQSDRNGFHSIAKKVKRYMSYDVQLSLDGDTARFFDFYTYPPSGKPTSEQSQETSAKTFLFTDRAIYRPGQTLYFKGILLEKKGSKSRVVANEYVQVYLEDVNFEEVGVLRLKTNTYGAFSGSFALPASGLTGEYTLYADEDYEDESDYFFNLVYFDYEEKRIRVEEYKRPTFEVKLDTFSGVAALGDTVRISGKAMAYNGSAVDNAQVKYQITREVQFPYWYYWRSTYRPSGARPVIVSGEVSTTAEGAFEIAFPALPDAKIKASDYPKFVFSLKAVVLDAKGETREGETEVILGYHASEASINFPKEIIKAETGGESKVELSTTNLMKQQVAAEGVMRVWQLQKPQQNLKKRLWESPDLPLLSEKEFAQYFPYESYTDSEESEVPQKGKLMKEIPFSNANQEAISLNYSSWQQGSYLIEIYLKEKTTERLATEHRFELIESKEKALATDALLDYQINKESHAWGETAEIRLRSVVPNAWVTVDIEVDGEVIQTFVEQMKKGELKVFFPIPENLPDKVSIKAYTVAHQTAASLARRIKIQDAPLDEQKLQIETRTFTDKILPGSEQQWSFVIVGSQAAETEILASMYDASLDKFVDHQWESLPRNKVRDYSFYNSFDLDIGFSSSSFRTVNQWYGGYFSKPRQHFHQWDWFGFTIEPNQYVNKRYLERIYTLLYDSLNQSSVRQSKRLFAKKGFVTGSVFSEEDGSALPGVNIIIKGTTEGTISDIDGRYTLEATKGQILVFSAIGMVQYEVEIGKYNVIDVRLASDIQQLSEVVVTALGVVGEKKNLGYAVEETLFINEEIIFEEVPDAEADLAVPMEVPLAGAASGLYIRNKDGITLKLRGNNSINANQPPLYVVDGVIVSAELINEEDILSINLLKGKEALALYGSQAGNGVMIITTQSGQKRIEEELAKVNTRKNFQETAFFYPHLQTNEQGEVAFTFTSPEALTRWKLQLLAHDRNGNSAVKELTTITQKELMVVPNPPRFLRTGDKITLSSQIVSLSTDVQIGKVVLQLFDGLSGKPIDAAFGVQQAMKDFTLPAKGKTVVSWELQIPADLEVLQYKIVAKTGQFSDGEQQVIPVFSDKVFITESKPLMIRKGESKQYAFDKVLNMNSNQETIESMRLEVTTNPTWYAIHSLPYLMEFPHECAEQTFARYYANVLGQHILSSYPEIKKVLEVWSEKGAGFGILESNQSLKQLMLEESPWLAAGRNETERKNRLVALLSEETNAQKHLDILKQLEGMQMPSGGFPWFSGSPEANRYITQHIISGMGFLSHLQVPDAEDKRKGIAEKAFDYLDREFIRYHKESMRKESAKKITLSPIQLHYLYTRSFFPQQKMTDTLRSIYNQYMEESGKQWRTFSLQGKAQSALIQHRIGNTPLATTILQSLLEQTIRDEELGFYWKSNVPSWYWYESPIETHTLLMDAFREVLPSNWESDALTKEELMQELTLWLLNQKRTQHWSSTKSTTNVVYSLLSGAKGIRATAEGAKIKIGNEVIKTRKDNPELGTGHVSYEWSKEKIKPEKGKVEITADENSLIFGGLHLSYWSAIDSVEATGEDLKLVKTLFRVSTNDKGEYMEEVTDTSVLALGDLVRVRLEVSISRDMEFVHLKDLRGAGFEPVDVLSEYKWMNQASYYQSTKDVATHFFFDDLPRGVYSFTYDLRVNNKGEFTCGMATLQSMYAPEFRATSQSVHVRVK
ncbi:MG2 domain-containing protein [Cytophagales bacterium LB-30]|uniref:MG2 domain-containing protein n=1 Tax=Shiella aurantiaca TaxID=3058365 RepID=A0ABT8F0R5_9BACT|nr:MG2 domain-containing protein [Shiella aurantiaca]MDN4163939.1 MG2 domain-containing protein [Shiella aurantiaca]